MMFAHTHIYYTQQVEKDKYNNLLILGSILPDLALTGIIGWDDLHKKEVDSNRFESYVNNTYPKYTKLVTGIKRHNELDYTTHFDYKGEVGFAYQFQTPELLSLVKKACRIDDDRAVKVKTHNFLESAVEINILNDYPNLMVALNDALKQTNKNELSQVLAEYFQINDTDVENKVSEFLFLHTKYNLAQLDDWVLFWNELNYYFFNKDVDKDYVKQALKKSLEIISPLFKEFLETTIQKTKEVEL